MKNEFEKVAMRVSTVSIVWNVILSVGKLLVGILASSGAMVSDAVHSASDVFSTIIVMVGVKISAKESDEDHPYGHERLECVAAFILAVILALTGLGIGYQALTSLMEGDFRNLTVPGIAALIMAVVSIAVKEGMFWYTRHHAKAIDSSALMADAWHHRSDALSSVGAFVGIGFSMLGYPVMDVVASLIICLFIEKAAYDIFKDAIDKMVDKSCDLCLLNEMKQVALSVDGVLDIDLLQARMFGNKIYVDMEIACDGDRPLKETHQVAEEVHNAIEDHFPKVKHIMVHVNPVEQK